MNDLGIVILNYKNWEDTIKCIDSILYINRFKAFQIYIVDNNSENNSVEELDAYIKSLNVDFFSCESSKTTKNSHKVVLLKSPINGGYAAGNNIGVRQAILNENEYIFILNNDAIVYENTIDELILSLKDDIVLACPLIEDIDQSLSIGSARHRTKKYDIFMRHGILSYIFPRNKYIKNHYYNINKIANRNKPIEIDIPSGSAMLFTNKYFKEAGLLDERTFLYLEEFIIHENIKKLGYRTILNPNSRVLHIGGESTKTVNKKLIQNIRLDSIKVYLTNYRNVSSFAWCFIYIYFKFSNFIYNILK